MVQQQAERKETEHSMETKREERGAIEEKERAIATEAEIEEIDAELAVIDAELEANRDLSKRKNWKTQPPEKREYPQDLANLEQVEEKEAEWLIPSYIPKNQVTILAGDGGAGKTTIWCELAAAISSGRNSFLSHDLPFNEDQKPARVLFFSSEDSVEYTLKGRLRRAGANMSNIFFMDLKDEAFQEIKFNSEPLEYFISKYRPALVIFDPLQSFIPADVQMGSRNTMRNCMNPLIGLGERFGATFLIIVHTNKQGGVWGRKRIADSADIWDLSRSVLIAGEAEGNIRYISQEKSNYGALSQTVLFTLDTGKIEFQGYTDKRDKDFVMSTQETVRQAPVREYAKECILEYLEDGEKEASDLDSTLKEMGCSNDAIKRAKAELRKEGKVVCVSRGFSSKTWFWRLSPSPRC